MDGSKEEWQGGSQKRKGALDLIMQALIFPGKAPITRFPCAYIPRAVNKVIGPMERRWPSEFPRKVCHCWKQQTCRVTALLTANSVGPTPEVAKIHTSGAFSSAEFPRTATAAEIPWTATGAEFPSKKTRYARPINARYEEVRPAPSVQRESRYGGMLLSRRHATS